MSEFGVINEWTVYSGSCLHEAHSSGFEGRSWHHEEEREKEIDRHSARERPLINLQDERGLGGRGVSYHLPLKESHQEQPLPCHLEGSY